MHAYESCLPATSTVNASLHVVSADAKKNAWLIISRIIIDAFEDLSMHYPQASKACIRELQAVRKSLVNGKSGDCSK